MCHFLGVFKFIKKKNNVFMHPICINRCNADGDNGGCNSLFNHLINGLVLEGDKELFLHSRANFCDYPFFLCLFNIHKGSHDPKESQLFAL